MAEKTQFETVPCNLCQSTEYTITYRPAKTDFDAERVFSASQGIRGTQQIVTCKQCGLVYVNPRIKSQNIVEAYSEAVDELYVSQEKTRLSTFQKSIAFVEKFAPKKGKILDVGAAAGFFLKAALDHGWDVIGVEPNKWMGAWAKKKYGITIKQGVLKNAKFAGQTFDVVTMWDVLEHTPDPMAELQETNRILKQDGIVVINYPNIGSLLAKAAGEKWWFLLSVHLYYFTHATMREYLKKTGFEVIQISRYVQTLNLEHLFKMGGLYSPALSEAGLKVIRALGMSKWPIPYYASQANVVAKKTKDV